jgi:CheY-like chemotaxis protein
MARRAIIRATRGDAMGPAKKIVVVDDDEAIRHLLALTLPAPEFEVVSFGDGRDALMALHDLAPDLILCDIMMPEMDGRTFFQVVKRSETLRHVPFVFLSAIEATDQIVATMDAGADDYVSKPFSPQRLLAKIRAVLRLAGRTAPHAEDRRQDQLEGSLGPKGPLPLVKFCESVRLSGRLTVRAAGVERWAEFLGGELVQAGGGPEVAGEEPIDLLLAMTAGDYRVDQHRLDASQLQALAQGQPMSLSAPDAEASAEGPAQLPGGLLARLAVRGEDVTIQTEAENRPDFTITTLIARHGQVLRKIESAWPHPLQRRGDQAAAETQVHRQHERVAASVRELATAPPRPAPTPGGAAAVDGALLAWAVSFVVEQARDLLGSVMTVAVLRRTHKRLQRDREPLRAFKVGADGRVSVERGREALAGSAVVAAAAWVEAFLAEATTLVERAGRIRVRQATRMMEADLEKIGFYAALGAAGGA